MASVKRDYYEVLGVSREAEPDEIQKAFHARARELHPDVSEDPEADEGFRELAQAYEVLSKPQARLLYDRFGFRGVGHGGFAGADDEAESVSKVELYDWIVNGRRPRRGADAYAEVEIDEVVAAGGTTRRVKLTRVEACGTCGGDGIAPGATSKECAACRGRGWRKDSADLDAGTLLQLEPCDECGGSGISPTRRCDACDGEGRVTRERKLRVKIPPGTQNGQRLRLAGQGQRGAAGGESGDAWILVRVRPLPKDSRLLRYGALAGLACAASFLVLLFISPPV